VKTTLLLCLLPVLPVCAVEHAALTDGGFELRAAAWQAPWGGSTGQASGGGQFVAVDEPAPVRTGKGALCLYVGDAASAREKAWAGITQQQPCRGGYPVRVGAWCLLPSQPYPPEAATRPAVKLEFYADRAATVPLPAVIEVSISNRVYDTWLPIRWAGVAPEKAQSLKYSLVLISSDAREEQQAFFDDAFLEAEGVTAACPDAVHALAVPDVLLARGHFYLHGSPFWVKGVGYSPFRPRQVPRVDRYGSQEVLRQDMQRIRDAGFNTLRTWTEMPDRVYELAAEYDLQVLSGVGLQLGDLSDPLFHQRAADILRHKIMRLRGHANIMGYLILNEPDIDMVERAGPENMKSFFRKLVETVHDVDPFRPVTATPWVNMWPIDMACWDMLCLNIYNYFPTAVNTNLGYQHFIEYVKKQKAVDRPFIVTEFGYPVNPGGAGGYTYGGNSLGEQATGVVSIIKKLVAGGAQGGCVFEWNDEWWKPFNTERDEYTHDDDPEEYFGMIAFQNDDDRIGTPRPVYDAVSNLYRRLVLAPRSGAIYTGDVPVAVYLAEAFSGDDLSFSVDSGPWQPLQRLRGGWRRTTLPGSDLSVGAHEIRFRSRYGGVLSNQTVKCCVAEKNPKHDYILKLQAHKGDTDTRIVKFQACLRTASNNAPVMQQPIMISILQSRPLSDTLYRGMTDSNGCFSVYYFPPRSCPRAHLIAWAGTRFTHTDCQVFAADDVTVPLPAMPVPEAALYQTAFHYTDREPVIDGQRDDLWPRRPTVELSVTSLEHTVLTVKGQWFGNQDLSGSVYALWDEEALYLFADIQDDTPMHNPWDNQEIWRGDAMEIFLGLAAKTAHDYRYSNTDFQFILAPESKTWIYGQAAGGVRDEPIRDVEMVAVPSEREYRMEARIPWENFDLIPVTGQLLRVEFNLNDTVSGQGLPTKMLWATSGDAYRSTAHWGQAELVGPVKNEARE
jgi:hypothetical protein